MKNCLNCSKELTLIPGRVEKKYCNDKCRGEYWRKNKPKEKFIKITVEEYERLTGFKMTVPKIAGIACFDQSGKITKVIPAKENTQKVTPEPPKQREIKRDEMPAGLSKTDKLKWFRQHESV